MVQSMVKNEEEVKPIKVMLGKKEVTSDPKTYEIQVNSADTDDKN